MRIAAWQRSQAIEAAAEAAYERDRAAGGHWQHTAWWLADEPTKQSYRDRMTAPVDAVLRCVSRPAETP